MPGGMHDLAWHAGIHPPPWTEFLKHTCENITFPRAVNMQSCKISMKQNTLRPTSKRGTVSENLAYSL